MALGAVVALVTLVVVPIRLVTGGGSDDQAQVSLAGTQESAAAESTGTEPTATGTASSDPTPAAREKKKARGKQDPALPEPQGSCAPEDVVVRPEVAGAVAGRAVTVTLVLRTRLAEACTWEMSRSSFTWKVTSGSDEIWTSRECPRAVPSRELVVRRETRSETTVTWGGRRSDAECSRLTAWALPGYYHVTVAALAGEPRSTQFELQAPAPATITASPEAGPGSTKDKGAKKRQRDREEKKRR